MRLPSNVIFVFIFGKKSYTFRNNINFSRRYNILYDVLLNITVTDFVLTFFLGHHNEADLHTVFYSCAEHCLQAFVSFLVEHHAQGNLSIYLYVCLPTVHHEALVCQQEMHGLIGAVSWSFSFFFSVDHFLQAILSCVFCLLSYFFHKPRPQQA